MISVCFLANLFGPTSRDILTTTKDIITTAAALTAIFVGVSGLDTWKKQLKGRTDYELSRRYLRSLLKLRDSLQYVRNPLITAGEFTQSRKEIVKESESPDTVEDNVAVYIVRWKKVQEALSDLQIESFEAQVSWGQEILRLEKPIKQLVTKLNVNLMLMLDKELEYSEKKESHEVVYNSGSDDNPDKFTSELNIAIENVETYLTRYLR